MSCKDMDPLARHVGHARNPGIVTAEGKLELVNEGKRRAANDCY